MKDNSQKRDTSIEEEVIIFLSMCSEEDRKFMEIPRKKRTVEQYARLMTICFYLGFKKSFLHFAARGGKKQIGRRGDRPSRRAAQRRRENKTLDQRLFKRLFFAAVSKPCAGIRGEVGQNRRQRFRFLQSKVKRPFIPRACNRLPI